MLDKTIAILHPVFAEACKDRAELMFCGILQGFCKINRIVEHLVRKRPEVCFVTCWVTEERGGGRELFGSLVSVGRHLHDIYRFCATGGNFTYLFNWKQANYALRSTMLWVSLLAAYRDQVIYI